MRGGGWAALAGCLLALAGLGWGGVRIHNDLVALEVAVDAQWSQVENQLERQHDLLPRLVTVTKAYADHERGILEKIAEARTRYLEAAPAQRPAAAGEVDAAFAQLLLVAESYPDLKADVQFRELSYEIAGTQNRIALERKRYNDQVALHNARIRQLPWRILASDREPRAFYDPPAERVAAPTIGL